MPEAGPGKIRLFHDFAGVGSTLALTAVIAQVGERRVIGVGMFASGGYVFRLWDDDRKRLKLLMVMYNGGYFAPDPGNDLGLNANALGVAVAYETPF